MDNNEIDFIKFLENVNKLENIIKNQMSDRKFDALLYKRFNISIDNVDKEYNKLLLRKVTENLIHEKIFNLIN